MKNIVYKNTNSLYEIPILIQTSEKIRLEGKDDYFNQTKINYINKHYPSFLNDYDFLIKSTEKIMDSYENLREVNSILSTGFLLSIILSSDAKGISDLSKDVFLKGSTRAVFLHFTDSSNIMRDDIIIKADSFVENDSIDSKQIYTLINELELDHDQKFSLIKYLDQIEIIYEDFLMAFDEISLFYRMFQSKYEYLLDNNFKKYGKPKSLKDWGVERWFDVDQFDFNNADTYYMYSLVHASGLIAKISSHGIGNVVMKGIFSNELENLELSEEYDLSVVHAQLLTLGDENRLKIFTALQSKPYYARELADHLDLSPSTISHHISILSSAGLIKMTSKGKRVYYTINHEELKDLALYFNNLVEQKEVPNDEY